MNYPLIVAKALVLVIAFSCLALGGTDEQTKIENCGEWVNCNYNPPNFDGTCCRICYYPELGRNEWYCAVHTNDEGFTDEEKANLKGKFLYDGENRDVRELLIIELNTETVPPDKPTTKNICKDRNPKTGNCNYWVSVVIEGD